MIHPFEVNPSEVDKRLKPASCGIPLGGRCVYWEYDHVGWERRKLEKQSFDLHSGETLELPANSIVYATLAPTFRLPEYIAARFNLSIRYVYRGLLVGTGPLVDPGFRGRLSIPLHNLTAYSCPIPSGDAVLWMEFTKISDNDRWRGERSQPRRGRYVEFPDRKLDKRKTVEDYVALARNGKPIISSIPERIEKASAEATRTRRYAQLFQFGVAVALVALVATFLSFVHDVGGGASSDADMAVDRSSQAERRVNRLETELRAVQRRAAAEVR
jgi:deoxycytidine triphosphate deaminase